MNTDLWTIALDTVLRDTDTLTESLAAACIGVRVRRDATARLAGDLALGRPLNAVPAVAVPELLALVLCETPDVAMRARALLRERLLAEHSEAVADIYWRRQDEAQAPREIDACDAYRRWRDRDLEERT